MFLFKFHSVFESDYANEVGMAGEQDKNAKVHESDAAL